MIAVVKGIAVIWAAHVFAATVAHTSRLTERESVGTALRHALIASTGLILASAGPLAILQLGVAGPYPR